MTLRPLGAQLIVKRAPMEEKSEGGLVLVEPSRQSLYVDVVAVGPKVTSDIKVGDRLLPYGWQGKPVFVDGEELLCVLERDIDAVLE